MKKKFLLLVAIPIFGLLSGCFPQKENTKNIADIPPPQKYNNEINDEKKLALARERFRENTAIAKADYMMSKNNPKEALTWYLPILAKLPEDIILHKKVANAYFLLKDYKNAYKHFVFVPLKELSEGEKNNMILSLFYQEDFIQQKNELQKFTFDENEKGYYEIIAECYHGANVCTEKIESYTGEYQKIQDLKTAIFNSKKISPEPNYVYLSLAKSLYEQQMYRLVGMFASQILATSPSYQEVKKLRAFSLYELGRYQDSIDLMGTYLEKNPKDLEVIIRLGEANTFLGKYDTANLYFNNAILAGYSPKTLIERRLAYNYAKMNDTNAMIKVLSYLLQEEDAKEDDFAVAISLAIKQKEFMRAYSWSHQGLKKFPNSKILTPLFIQSLRENGQKEEAEKYIQELPTELTKLPILQLEKAILHFEKDEFNEAKTLFEALKNLDQKSELAQEAELYLQKIIQKEQEIQNINAEMTQSSDENIQKDTSFWEI